MDLLEDETSSRVLNKMDELYKQCADINEEQEKAVDNFQSALPELLEDDIDFTISVKKDYTHMCLQPNPMYTNSASNKQVFKTPNTFIVKYHKPQYENKKRMVGYMQNPHDKSQMFFYSHNKLRTLTPIFNMHANCTSLLHTMFVYETFYNRFTENLTTDAKEMFAKLRDKYCDYDFNSIKQWNSVKLDVSGKEKIFYGMGGKTTLLCSAINSHSGLAEFNSFIYSPDKRTNESNSRLHLRNLLVDDSLIKEKVFVVNYADEIFKQMRTAKYNLDATYAAHKEYLDFFNKEFSKYSIIGNL